MAYTVSNTDGSREITVADGTFDTTTYSVTLIGKYAFEYNGLTNIQIPNSVKYICERAVHYNNLTDLQIPNSVIYIGNCAFQFNKFSFTSTPQNI